MGNLLQRWSCNNTQNAIIHKQTYRSGGYIQATFHDNGVNIFRFYFIRWLVRVDLHKTKIHLDQLDCMVCWLIINLYYLR